MKLKKKTKALIGIKVLVGCYITINVLEKCSFSTIDQIGYNE